MKVLLLTKVLEMFKVNSNLENDNKSFKKGDVFKSKDEKLIAHLIERGVISKEEKPKRKTTKKPKLKDSENSESKED